MYFNGTIIITDPSYLSTDKEFISDKMLKRDTLYGDWRCTTYRVNNIQAFFTPEGTDGKPIGEFTADSGQVCVCYLDEVLAFNPDFAKWALYHNWCVTVIPNFTGQVNFKEKDNNLHVVGEGNIKFVTTQTGL